MLFQILSLLLNVVGGEGIETVVFELVVQFV